MGRHWPRVTLTVWAIGVVCDAVLASALYASGPTGCDPTTNTRDAGTGFTVLVLLWLVAPVAVIAAGVVDAHRARARPAVAAGAAFATLCGTHLVVAAAAVSTISVCL